MSKHNLWLVSALALTLSTGFYLGNPEDDVEQFISTTKSTTRGNPNLNLGELPKEISYTPYQYQAGGFSPFALRGFVEEIERTEVASDGTVIQKKVEECRVAGPMQHTPYFLERYDLSSLRMVGIMFDKNKEVVALIQTPDTGIHYARRGEYIGRDNGLIGDIQSSDLEKNSYMTITEKVKLPGGCWESRPKRLDLYPKL